MNEIVSNMYCSGSYHGDDDDETYALEHPFDENQSGYESDCCDEDALNSYEPVVVEMERTVSEMWGSRWVKGPTSVVLTSDKTFEKTGYRTRAAWNKAQQDDGELARQARVSLELQKKMEGTAEKDGGEGSRTTSQNRDGAEEHDLLGRCPKVQQETVSANAENPVQRVQAKDNESTSSLDTHADCENR